MKYMLSILLIFSIAIPITPARAHDGITDKNGCHTDNDGTNFHCHEERKFDPKALVEPRKPGHNQRSDEQREPSPSPQAARRNADQNLDALSKKRSQPRFATFDQVQALQDEITQLQNQPAPERSFDDSAASKALWISLGLVTLSSLVGAGLASEGMDGAFLRIALPSISGSLMTSSTLALQVGLDTDTKWTGYTAVGAHILAPLVLGAIINGL